MAITRKKTSVLLGGIAIVFVIVLIILILSPTNKPSTYYGDKPVTDSSYRGPEETTLSSSTYTTTDSTTTSTSTLPPTTSSTENVVEYIETTTETVHTTSGSTTDLPETSSEKLWIFESTTNGTVDETTTERELDATTILEEQPTTTETTTAKYLDTTAHEETTTETITTEEEFEETTPVETTTLSRETTTIFVAPTERDTTESTIGDTTVFQITTEESTTEESTTEEMTTQETTVADTTIQETTMQETTSQETTTHESTIQETTTHESTLQETTTQESTSQETTTQELETEKSTTDTATTEEPIIPMTRHQTCQPKKEECTSADCKVLASRMLSMMNHSTSPCDDFYEFACGGTEDNPFLLPEDPEVLVFDRIKGMFQTPDKMAEASLPAKIFYESCLNRSSKLSDEEFILLSEMGRNLSEFGEPNPNYRPDDWLAHFILHDFTPFFEVRLDAEKSEGQFQVQISLPVRRFDTVFSEFFDTHFCKAGYIEAINSAIIHGLPSLDVAAEYTKYMQCLRDKKWTSPLNKQIRETVTALNITGHFQDKNKALDFLGDTLFDLEFFFSDLRADWPTGSSIRQAFMTKNYTEVEVSRLNQLFPLKNFDWQRFLRTVVGEDVFKVQLYHAQHLADVFATLMQYERDLDNFFLLLWNTHLYTNLVTPLATEPNPQYCMKLTKYLVPDMVAETYLRSFTESEHDLMTSQAREVANKVKITIEEALQDDPQISQVLKEKLERSQVEVGAKNSLAEIREHIESTKHELELGQSYVVNCVKLLKRRRTKMYSLKEFNSWENLPLWTYFNTPYNTSPRTIYATNTILIPEGSLSPPAMYPNSNLPDYILYAGMGHIISHELMHAVDTAGLRFGNYETSGGQFPKSPEMERRISSVSKILYGKEFHLVVGSNKEYVTLDYLVPKTLHLNEVLADVEATRLAWLSYTNRHNKSREFPETQYLDYDSERRRKRSLAHDAPVEVKSDEHPLVWMDMSPQQIFYLKMAQNHCARKSYLDVAQLMEFEHLPPRMRVNIALAFEPLFGKAFGCSAPQGMVLPSQFVGKFFVNDLHKEPNKR